MGLRTPFGRGGFETAALSAGLAKGALYEVLTGRAANAYALSRPPGHHCLPEFPNGFCLLANIAIAIEAALAEGLTERIAVVDRLIMALAVSEMMMDDAPPVAVVLDEYVELAKVYSTEGSGSFVNGVLSSISKSLARS